jgi:uncharacterized protein (DUF427 family)
MKESPTMEAIKVPGPDHPITIAAAKGRTRARYMDHVIADSADALLLKEAGYDAVAYFPRADVSMEYLARTDRVTHCPYKGNAAYFTLTMDGAIAENAVWTYEAPYPAMASIAGRLAFFPNVVEVYEVAADHSGPTPDQVVLHTDAGDGASQKEHWPANVSEPPA